MKTIEEKAERYEHWADQINNRWDKPEEHIPFKEQIKRAFIAGAKSSHAELTRWHDPKEKLPELLTPVLGKQSDGKKTYYKIVYRRNYDECDGWYWTDNGYCSLYIDGWREIHE